MQFIVIFLLTFDRVDSFFEVAKISYQALVIAVFIFCIFKSIYVCYVMYAKIVKQLHVYAITSFKVFCAINIKIAWINPWLIGHDMDMISL